MYWESCIHLHAKLNTKKYRNALLCKVLRYFELEATTRFELVIRVLQTHALPLGYVAILYCMSQNVFYSD